MRRLRPRRPTSPLLSAAVAALALLLAPEAPAAQERTIPEYRELLLAKEGSLARLERELATANTGLDRLVAEKEAAGSPRRSRSQELSAEILKVSQRIADLERQRRATLADLQALRTALDGRYSRTIDANLARLDRLPQTDPAYSDLLVETGRYVASRDSLRVQIRIQENLQNFREFPIVATDGPAEIREKAGFYRDYVRDVTRRIRTLERAIEDVRERERVGRRMRELQEDLAFLGEDVPTRPGGESVGDLREDAEVGESSDPLALLAQPAVRRVAALEEEKRQLELLRARFEAKVREYEERARTIYSRQTTPTEEESR